MGSDKLHRALITGASSGIGKATALAFAKSGIDLALVGRSLDRLQPVVAAAKEMGSKTVKSYEIDFAETNQIKARLSDLLADFGKIDILVNSAGIGYTGALATMPISDWQQVINLNLTGVFQCIQGILPTLRQEQGIIVNVASVAGKSGFPGWGAYSVSKAGLITLSKVLAAEERDNGVRVVTISPGAVNTPIWDTETVDADFDRSKMLTPEVVAETILNAVLLPNFAVIEDVSLMPSAGAL